MSATGRKLQRAALRGAAADQARLLGCRCAPVVRIQSSSDRVHHLDVAHDRECWLAESRLSTIALVDLRNSARCGR